MKILKYKILQDEGLTEDNEITSAPILEVETLWTESMEEWAKVNSYNGEYEIYEDEDVDLTQEPSTEEILDVLLGVN
jgi:hypothetical protein